MEKIYACIDLKSFYASCECMKRNIDPLDAFLVVADDSRTDKTICLAVTPSLKELKVPGRPRLYEAKSVVRQINYERKKKNRYKAFRGKTTSYKEFKNNPFLELDFIIAKPHMQDYLNMSALIYETYLEFVSKDDIFVYSIDEVFIDLTPYLKIYKKDALAILSIMIKRVYDKTGITATGGAGTNLYLAKIAMDILAKHEEPNDHGVRIAYLDEKLYKERLWEHEKLSDFWRIGKKTAYKLNKYNIYTMKDIARCFLMDEDLLFKLFGVNAETLIDHAFGKEYVNLADIKKYKSETKSISEGQVLSNPFPYEKARLIIKEMSDNLALSLTEHNYLTKKLILYLSYDVSNITEHNYYGRTALDAYGRLAPYPSRGTINMKFKTASSKMLCKYFLKLYDEIAGKNLLIRKICVAAEIDLNEKDDVIQLDFFSEENMEKVIETTKEDEKLQRALLNIKTKYGKNSILKGMNLLEDATARKRNQDIGGHSA